jgi:hypothetical protein
MYKNSLSTDLLTQNVSTTLLKFKSNKKYITKTKFQFQN